MGSLRFLGALAAEGREQAGQQQGPATQTRPPETTDAVSPKAAATAPASTSPRSGPPAQGSAAGVAELVPINEVARRLGLRASAIRYYEERGLLRPSARRAGRRWYSPPTSAGWPSSGTGSGSGR